MKWFKHDSEAHRDAKLRKVLMNYGMEGYGLYWYCLEEIARTVTQEKFTFELEHDSQILAFDTGLSVKKVEEMMAFMVNIGLFENSNGTVTCLRLAKRIDKSMTSNQEMRNIIAGLKKNNQLQIENHDCVMTASEASHDSSMTRLEEKRKENIYAQFCAFWESYPKKVDKKKSEKAFGRLSKENQQAAIADIKSGRYAKTEKRFVPNPTTYINGERWKDEATSTTAHGIGMAEV